MLRSSTDPPGWTIADVFSLASASTLSSLGRNPSEARTLPSRLWPSLCVLSIDFSIAPILSCWPVSLAGDVSSLRQAARALHNLRWLCPPFRSREATTQCDREELIVIRSYNHIFGV